MGSVKYYVYYIPELDEIFVDKSDEISGTLRIEFNTTKLGSEVSFLQYPVVYIGEL